jgi:hypothetical protein
MILGNELERKKERKILYFLNNSTHRQTILFVKNTKLYNIHMAEKLVNKGEILRRLC